ncbi:MAG: MarR family transcriptional regulator [Lachnospiraceae bacterium]
MDYFVNTQMKHFNLLLSEIDAAYHDAALRLGLSDSAMLILYTICWCDGECLLSDITSGASKQTINSALRKLEADNIVCLEAFEGRKKKVRLTEEGNQFVKDTVFRLIEVENAIFNIWSDEEKNTYIELTRRYLTDFRERIKEL